MLNIVIPMSGRGSRFVEAGYLDPKPLIDVHNWPMIGQVIMNINLQANYIFLVLKEHYQKYYLKYLLPLFCEKLNSTCQIIQVDQITEGAACTVLLAKHLINNLDELLVVNSDQIVEWEVQHFLSYLRNKRADGGIVTFIATEDKWSFAKLNKNKIVEVAEKQPISNIATVGIYWFKTGQDYVWAAEQMISKNIRTRNEFYLCPVFNELIAANKIILNYPVAEMHGLGTPEDLQNYLNK